MRVNNNLQYRPAEPTLISKMMGPAAALHTASGLDTVDGSALGGESSISRVETSCAGLLFPDSFLDLPLLVIGCVRSFRA